MKKLVSTILAVIMMVMVMSAPALAANTSSTIYIWNEGEQKAEGFLRDGEVYVNNYSDVTKIFPTETTDWVHIQLTEATPLKMWADSFGYTFTVEANNCFLLKVSAPNQPSPRTSTSRVFIDGNLVKDVVVYLSDVDATVFADKANLEKIFPDNKGKFTFEEMNAYTLNYWANQFGYSLEITASNNRVDLISNNYRNRTYVSVYVNGSLVHNVTAYTIGGGYTVYSDRDSLEKIFPENAGKFTITDVNATTINYWAGVLDYTMTLSGNRVDITANNYNNRTYVIIYVNGSLINNTNAYMLKNSSTVYADRATLERVFPENVGKFTSYNVNADTVNYWANVLGYTLSISGNRIDLSSNNNNQTPVSIYVEGNLIRNTNAYVIGNSTTVYTDRASLEKIFPAYANQFSFTDANSYTVNYWTTKLGYDMSMNGTRVDLTSNSYNDRTYVSVYMDGKVINNLNTYIVNRGSTVYADKLDLEKIFPTYAGQFDFTDPNSYTVNYWARRLGYTLNITNNRVDLNSYFVPSTGNEYKLVIDGCTTSVTPKSRVVGNISEIHVTESEAASVLNRFNVSMTNKPTEIRALAARCNRSCVIFGNRVYFNTEKPIEVRVNGNPIDFSDVGPVIKDGRTLLPVRATSNALGAEVGWDGDTRMVTITKGNTTIQLFIGIGHFYVNGVKKSLDVAPIIIDGRTMLPIRAIAENLNYEVTWDGSQAVGIVGLNAK